TKIIFLWLRPYLAANSELPCILYGIGFAIKPVFTPIVLHKIKAHQPITVLIMLKVWLLFNDKPQTIARRIYDLSFNVFLSVYTIKLYIPALAGNICHS